MGPITPWTLALALLAAVVGGGAEAETIRLMTGPQGGVWVPLGGQLKDMWEKAVPGLSVQSMPGAGIANVRGIEEGKTEVGFGNSISTVDALTGAAPFNKPHKNVCNVATLYPQYFQVRGARRRAASIRSRTSRASRSRRSRAATPPRPSPSISSRRTASPTTTCA